MVNSRTAQHAGLRPCLVAELRLDLEPDLREVAIGTELESDRGEDLLGRHAEAKIRIAPVLEPEHLLADELPTPALLPDLAGVERGQAELLRPDPLHLLAHHTDDLLGHAKAEREERVDARHQLPHEARAHQEPMAHGLGVGRVVAQCRDECLLPAHGFPLFEQPETSALCPRLRSRAECPLQAPSPAR